MRIAVAQLNAVVGALRSNAEHLLVAAKRAREQGADLLVAPELALCGYPPRDLLERTAFLEQAQAMLGELIERAPLPMLVGAIVSHKGDPLTNTGRWSNGAVLAHAGSLIACYRKQLLPTYDIFDEARYFVPGRSPSLVRLGDTCIGITICEDIWSDKAAVPTPRYDIDPLADAVAGGAELLINLSASPYDREKPAARLALLQRLARQHARPILYVNQTGAHDSVVFDGRSLGVSADGEIGTRMPAFAPQLGIVHYERNRLSQAPCGRLVGDLAAEPSSWEEDVTHALTLGVSDYMEKCGFTQAVIGLSGGIDSALVCALAVRALGPSRVLGVAMPSRYSSKGSIADAQALAQGLGIRLDIVPIEPMVAAFEDTLNQAWHGLPNDITEENLQARIRGVLLMAYSNKENRLLLTTGNKSEVAVGYCTLYGDMNGGLGLISDLYKTEVYALSHYLNRTAGRALIPESTLTKAPSAELRPGQTDQDSLPPYEELDAILRGYVDQSKSVQDLVAEGFSKAVVERIARMIAHSEYKRRQMAPGLRVSSKAFGEGRRLPLAQRWDG